MKAPVDHGFGNQPLEDVPKPSLREATNAVGRVGVAWKTKIAFPEIECGRGNPPA
jgi:hypothetical protein